MRIEAAKAVRNIILKLQEEEELFSEFLGKVLLFRASNKYNLRQTFVCMCESMMKQDRNEKRAADCKALFVTFFLGEFLSL